MESRQYPPQVWLNHSERPRNATEMLTIRLFSMAGLLATVMYGEEFTVPLDGGNLTGLRG